MSLDLINERGVDLDRQRFTWREAWAVTSIATCS
jgi:hypothetical protein